MKRVFWWLIPFILFISLAFFLWRGLFLDPHYLPSTQLGKSLPEFELPLLDCSFSKSTAKQHVFSPKLMRGHVVLLNVWASWCSTCFEEQAFLLKLARQGILIYGLNYKDKTKRATHWLADWGNPYQFIGEDKTGRVAMDLGVYGTPETFLIDKKGYIRYRYAGALNQQVWRSEFIPRIRQLSESS